MSENAEATAGVDPCSAPAKTNGQPSLQRVSEVLKKIHLLRTQVCESFGRVAMALMKLPRYRHRSLACAAIGLLALAGAAEAQTDLAACYGDTLDVAFRGWSNGGYDGTRIVLRLPFPNEWNITVDASIQGADGPQTLLYYPCLPEPIYARAAFGGLGVWGGKIMDRLSRSEFAPMTAETTGVTAIDIRYGSRESLSPVFDHDIKYTLENGKPFPGGFFRVYPREPDPTNGMWLLPESYKTPDDRRFAVGCGGGQCTVQYMLTPETDPKSASEKGIVIYYRFSPDFEDFSASRERSIKTILLPDRWAEQDRIVRKIVNSWIVEGN